MIDYPDQAGDRLQDAGVPDDIKWLGARFDDAMQHWAKKVYDAMRRQESPNPSNLNLNPGFIFRTTTKMRTFALTFSGGTAGDHIGLLIGTAVDFDWFVPASPAPFTLPMYLPFDAGVDISIRNITNVDHLDWLCRVWAYTELEDGGDA
jgi:hypothetical protein